MNYFELHIGDYETATAHLTACEDGIYSRMMRRYYATEQPLPADLKGIQRLVRARTREEKTAVATIATEFFTLTHEGYRHTRCDEELERFQVKRDKARRSAEARWGTGANASERNANASDPSMRTHSEGNASQTPVTSNQSSPDRSSTPDRILSGEQQPPVSGGTPAGHAAAALNRLGVRVTSLNPNLIAACAEGVTTDDLLELQRVYPEKPAAYLIATARRQRAEPASPTPTGGSNAKQRTGLGNQVRRSDATADAIEGTSTRIKT